MSNTKIPSYLELLAKRLPGQPSTTPTHYTNAFFRHRRFPALSHALWWPSSNTSRTCLIFVTGNPGLVDFYTPFLTALHEKTQEKIDIFGHALVGQTPGVDEHPPSSTETSLHAQVEGLLEVVDAVKSDHDRIIIAGHSIGSWVCLQVLKLRHLDIQSVFLLFPTICHMVDTPNGRNLAMLFKPPLPRVVSWVSVLTRLIPMWALSRILYPDWPTAQLDVLRGFLNSPSCVYASLCMAHEEMTTVTDLDIATLQDYRHRLHLYFADRDDWVGEHKDKILNAFDADEGSVKITHGPKDIPHAFCINHGEEVAEQCFEWLQSGGFI